MFSKRSLHFNPILLPSILLILLIRATSALKDTACPKCDIYLDAKCIGGELIYDEKDQVCKMPTEDIQKIRTDQSHVWVNYKIYSDDAIPQQMETNDWTEFCKTEVPPLKIEQLLYYRHPTLCFKIISCHSDGNGTVSYKELTCEEEEGKMLHSKISDDHLSYECLYQRQPPNVPIAESHQAPYCKDVNLKKSWQKGWEEDEEHPCSKFENMVNINTAVAHPKDCRLSFTCIVNTPNIYGRWPNVTFSEYHVCPYCKYLPSTNNWHCPEGYLYFDPEKLQCVEWSALSSKRRNECARIRDRSTVCPKCNPAKEKECFGGRLIYDEVDKVCKLPTENIKRSLRIPFEMGLKYSEMMPWDGQTDPEFTPVIPQKEVDDICRSHLTSHNPYWEIFKVALPHPTMCFRYIACVLIGSGEFRLAYEDTCHKTDINNMLPLFQISITDPTKYKCQHPNLPPDVNFRVPNCTNKSLTMPKVVGMGWDKSKPGHPCSKFESPGSMNILKTEAHPTDCSLFYGCKRNTQDSVASYPNVTFVELMKCSTCDRKILVSWHCPYGHLYYDIDKSRCAYWSELSSKRRTQCALGLRSPGESNYEKQRRLKNAEPR